MALNKRPRAAGFVVARPLPLAGLRCPFRARGMSAGGLVRGAIRDRAGRKFYKVVVAD